MYDLICKTKELIDKKYAPDGYNIGINDGEAAGRTVPHLHIHIIPRYAGDVKNPRGGIRNIIPGKGTY
jgi:diadenosine tetraphosphate (Ap4A) HIT family hydrolase